ncbi:lysozyme [Serratia plymuthica]|uniref:lysozyme n=1 Tax=Serratia plymuthica TaxID=82996 RepID=UPI003DA472C6
MVISNQGINLIKHFEGYRLKAYPDPATHNVPWTIGYGWTQLVDGIQVHPEMVITEEKAEQLLKKGLKQYQLIIDKLVTTPLNQHQFDACVSLVYNIGRSAFNTSTLLKKLNSGDIEGAAEEFLRWNKANGKVMQGLVERRAAEKALFLS